MLVAKRWSMLSMVAGAFLMMASSPYIGATVRGTELSQSRIQSIQKIVSDYQKSGEKLSDPDVQKAIFSDISKLMPLVPKGKPDIRDVKELADEVREIVAKRYPESPESIRKEANRLADEKFAMSKIMDYVKVRTQKGEDFYTFEGVFYGYGGNSIKIGDRYIAIFDLLPDYRIKFDKAYNEQERKAFVEGRVNDYFTKKNQYSLDTFRKLREEQAKKNEESGYINAWKDWRTARNITEILIATEISKGSSETKPEKEPGATTVADDPGADEHDPDGATLPAGSQPTSPKNALEELKKRLEKQHAEIANNCSGIDTDQGYKTALWGLTRDEVGAILAGDGVTVAPDKDSDMIVPKDGPTKKIELQYLSGYFVRVNVWFRVVDQEGFNKLSNILRETYGLTDEERKAKEDAEAEKSVDSAENADAKKKDDKKKDDKKAPPPTELEYHWTGKTTVATIYVKFNKERTVFEEVRLTKECPALIQNVTDELHRRSEQKKKPAETEKTFEKEKVEF